MNIGAKKMKISVIIPAYNCAKYIGQTLDCVRLQSFPQRDLEAIVYIDGSRDNTSDVVHSYAKKHPDFNLKIIDSDENHGVSYARNRAIAMARGEYMHFMDSDDIINTDFYKNLYDAAHRTNSDVAVSEMVFEYWHEQDILFNTETIVSVPQDKINITCVDTHGYPWRYLIRRRFWTQHKYCFPENMRYCEDMLVMTTMVTESEHIVVVPGARYMYMARPNSLVLSPELKSPRDIAHDAAVADVEMFLQKNELQPTYDKCMANTEYKYYRLFNLIPLIVSVTPQNKSYTKFYLFGLFSILKIRRKLKTSD